MKNTIKMSLVAALAVAGLSTSASAGSLEEAIKGVSISGKMEVEYDYTTDKMKGSNKNTTNEWDLDWDVTAKIPVNDNITAVVGAEGDQAREIHEDRLSGQGNAQVTKLNFVYQNGPVTAIVGKQGMSGAPWFDDERANGVVALYNAGPVILAAAHFDNQNGTALSHNDVTDFGFDAYAEMAVADGGLGLAANSYVATVDHDEADINAAAVIMPNIAGSGINASLWYADIAGLAVEVSNAGEVAQVDATSYSIGVDGKFFDMIGVDVRYTSTDYNAENRIFAAKSMAEKNLENTLEEDASLLKVIVSADFGVATPYIGYGKTDKDQHVAGVDLTTDHDSVADFGGEILSIDEMADADAFIIGVKVPVGPLALEAFYIDGDAVSNDVDYDEFYIGADYKMSKNFTIGAHFAKAEVDADINNVLDTTYDYTDAAISLEYKF